MKKIIYVLTILAFSSAAYAGPQQEKMKTCNAEAKTKALKGPERKAFMKSCLSGSNAAASNESAPGEKSADPRQRMRDCNMQAKTKALKGPERKAFMSSCLKN